MIPDTGRLRPHVKTNKMAEVCHMLLDAGITRFKCATIAEAEMLAGIGAPDVLLAYQPVGPKINRFIQLINAYPLGHFSWLTDNTSAATAIADAARASQLSIDVYIDLNVGMNRTGILPQHAMPLVAELFSMHGIRLIGLHAYDGHIRATDLSARRQQTIE